MASEDEANSKILIIGGTGYFGKYVVEASIAMGHPTYVYARPVTPDTTTPSKVELRNEFRSMGVEILEGELEEHEKLLSAIKQVDIVISTLGIPQTSKQLLIIDAIKIARNIKRFIPSAFGVEEDRIVALPPFQDTLNKKKMIKRATEAAGIPYTYVSSICFGTYFLNHLLHTDGENEEIAVFASGQAKVVFAYEKDVATYMIKVAKDPRTCNRIIFYRPPENIVSQLELIALWEEKTGQNRKKTHVSEEDIVKLSETSAHPGNIRACILHSIFVKGDLVNFELEEDDMEVLKLYPDFEYTTINQLLDIFITSPQKIVYTKF